LSHANLGIFEVNGSYRSKRYNIRHLKKAMTEGIAWLSIPSGLHPGDDIIPTNPFADPDGGYQDSVIRFDPESCRDMPFDSEGKGLLLIGEHTGEIADHCVRALLGRELKRLEAIGFDLYGGLELEGAVLAESAQSLRNKRPADVAVVPGFDKVYSFVDQSGHADLMDDLIEACATMGLPLDTVHIEYTHMLEVGMQPTLGMRIADNAALYKSVAKIIAERHGAYISFMARRNDVDQGCGAHINLSLRQKGTDDTAFYDANREDRMTDTMRYFVGGLNRYLPELFLLLAPHLNSFKRYQPGLFTPLNNTWGINNKTVMFRVLNVTPGATRIEVRPAGADICPHLGLLAVTAAGRLGIEQKIDPPAPIVGNGWSVEAPDGPPIPASFEEAIERFEASSVAREVTSDGFVDNFVSDRRWQLDAFSKTVTDWELALFGNL
jgi:glutamine synthetase